MQDSGSKELKKNNLNVKYGIGDCSPRGIEILVVDAEAMAGEAGRGVGSGKGYGEQNLEAEASGVGEEGREESRVLREDVVHEGRAAFFPAWIVYRCHDL